MSYMENVLRACVDKYVMIQTKAPVNIATVSPGDGMAFEGEHVFPATHIGQGQNGQRTQTMIQIPVLMGKVVERFGSLWLRMMDEVGGTGNWVLMAVDPDVVVAVTTLADHAQDPPAQVPAPAEPSRIVIPRDALAHPCERRPRLGARAEARHQLLGESPTGESAKSKQQVIAAERRLLSGKLRRLWLQRAKRAEHTVDGAVDEPENSSNIVLGVDEVPRVATAAARTSRIVAGQHTDGVAAVLRPQATQVLGSDLQVQLRVFELLVRVVPF